MLRSLRTIRSIPRIKDIAIILGKHGFHQVSGALQAPFRTTLRRLLKSEPKHVVQQPERLRMLLEDLGPTFIKFGQLLSTRPDLLPPEYIEELEKLQDEVSPVPFEEIRSLLEEEFEQDLAKVFSRLDPNPLASASIAQVHRATTPQGEEVVVKVRKRGLERIIRQDIGVLAALAEFLSGWRGLRLFDPEGIVRLFERSIQRELNFDYERYNLFRIRENLGEDSKVYVPRVFPELSRRGVLTIEYVAGEKLTQYRSRPFDPVRGKEIATHMALCVLEQVFEHGLFHADPHPGNFLIRQDGGVALIDFGNVGRFTREMKDDLLHLLVALVQRNYRNVSRWVLKHGQPMHPIDPQALALELMDVLEPYYGLKLEDIQIGGLFNSLFGLVFRHGITIPAQYVHAGRTFVVLEGAVRLCSPSLELIPAIQPYMTKLLQGRWAPDRVLRDLRADASELIAAVRSYPVNLAEVLSRAAEGKLRLEADVTGMESLGRRVEHATSRIQLAVLSSGMMVSSAILLSTQAFGSGSVPKILGLVAAAGALLVMVRMLLR